MRYYMLMPFFYEHETRLKTYWINNTCWSFLPTSWTLEYLFLLADSFFKG
jgi:hypothetical protein